MDLLTTTNLTSQKASQTNKNEILLPDGGQLDDSFPGVFSTEIAVSQGIQHSGRATPPHLNSDLSVLVSGADSLAENTSGLTLAAGQPAAEGRLSNRPGPQSGKNLPSIGNAAEVSGSKKISSQTVRAFSEHPLATSSALTTGGTSQPSVAPGAQHIGDPNLALQTTTGNGAQGKRIKSPGFGGPLKLAKGPHSIESNKHSTVAGPNSANDLNVPESLDRLIGTITNNGSNLQRHATRVASIHLQQAGLSSSGFASEQPLPNSSGVTDALRAAGKVEGWGEGRSQSEISTLAATRTGLQGAAAPEQLTSAVQIGAIEEFSTSLQRINDRSFSATLLPKQATGLANGRDTGIELGARQNSGVKLETANISTSLNALPNTNNLRLSEASAGFLVTATESQIVAATDENVSDGERLGFGGSSPVAPTNNPSSRAGHSQFLGVAQYNDPQFQRNLGDQVLMMAGQGINKAHLSLNPHELGPVEIRLSMVNDEVSIQVASANAMVRDTIEDAMPRLRELFDEAGLKLTGHDVASEFSNGGSSEFEDQDHAGALKNVAHAESEHDVNLTSGRSDSASLIDTYI